MLGFISRQYCESPLKLRPQLDLHTWVGQSRRTIAGHQIVERPQWPVFSVIVKREPCSGLAAQDIRTNLLSAGHCLERRLRPWVRAMNALVVGAANESITQ